MTQQEMTDTFTIVKSRFGLYTSIDADGNAMVTALTEEACRSATVNIHIPSIFGTFEGTTTVSGSAFVGGKL